MSKFFINGGNRLKGSVKVSTSKNATLPILAASILTDGEVIIKNLPNFSDIDVMLNILTSIGCKAVREDNSVIINSSSIHSYELPEELTNKVRASIFFLGPILSKLKGAKMSYPGGCNIGNRPIDLHLNGLRKLGAKIVEQHGYMYCDGKDMKGATIDLNFPSVGATENLMMASVLTPGTTTINNCAKEPEIVDVANFINSMGGKIKGAGSATIVVKGVKKLTGTTYTPIPDRIITGTYLIAGAMNGGKIELTGAKPEHILSLINKLENSACKVTIKSDKIVLASEGIYNSIPNIDTQVYPGFPTDLQSPIMAMQTVGRGVSVITENLFESRFKHVPELVRMGATIIVKEKQAVVIGEEVLYGAEVKATDLRAGASLVLAGLKAKGYTTVNDIYHIDRGYENLELNLQKLGADIKRI
jgi:UDP-N-acetylglucosamine 1-carboxyvinyltransferase